MIISTYDVYREGEQHPIRIESGDELRDGDLVEGDKNYYLLREIPYSHLGLLVSSWDESEFMAKIEMEVNTLQYLLEGHPCAPNRTHSIFKRDKVYDEIVEDIRKAMRRHELKPKQRKHE